MVNRYRLAISLMLLLLSSCAPHRARGVVSLIDEMNDAAIAGGGTCDISGTGVWSSRINKNNGDLVIKVLAYLRLFIAEVQVAASSQYEVAWGSGFSPFSFILWVEPESVPSKAGWYSLYGRVSASSDQFMFTVEKHSGGSGGETIFREEYVIDNKKEIIRVRDELRQLVEPTISGPRPASDSGPSDSGQSSLGSWQEQTHN